MPSDNCNNAHVTELRCVIIGNFRFSNSYQSEEYEMALFKVKVMCHRYITCVRRSQDRTSRPKHILPQTCPCYVDPKHVHVMWPPFNSLLYEPRREKTRHWDFEIVPLKP